jgi:hypothetical protein
MTKAEFKNTDLYPSVDWDKEIQTDDELSKDEHGTKSSNYVFAMNQIKDSIDHQIDEVGAENLSQYKKDNMMRMLEFLYCKFIYHHAMFYRKKDLLELKMEDNEHYKNPVLETREKLGEIKYEFNIPIKILQEMADSLITNIRKRLDESKPKDGGFEEAKEMFEKEGLVIERPIGIGKEGDRDTVCTIHDGIPYHMYLMKSSSYHGKREQSQAKKEVEEYKELIDKYHPLIKKVYNALKEQVDELDDLWVLSGGGAQLQAFFGSNGKYVGILYLGMKKAKTRPDKECTLVFEAYKDDDRWPRYKDFKLDDIEHRAFGKSNPFKDDKF